MRYKLSFESLEKRTVLSASDYLSHYIDVDELIAEPTYTTTDSPSNHVTGRGSPFAGVVKLDLDTSIGDGIGSGVLLPTGMHILTAAHNVTGADDNQFTVSDMEAVFELPTGDITREVVLSKIVVHPTWDPDELTLGSDIAILELESAAPATAPRFDIYRG